MVAGSLLSPQLCCGESRDDQLPTPSMVLLYLEVEYAAHVVGSRLYLHVEEDHSTGRGHCMGIAHAVTSYSHSESSS